MSVCTFGVGELANVAAAVLNGLRPEMRQSDRVHAVCAQLALISVANTACFADKYRVTDVAPVTAREIEKALRPVSRMPGSNMVCDLRAAVSTASLLHYNCDDDGGDFTLKFDGAPAALAAILQGVMLTLADKLES